MLIDTIGSKVDNVLAIYTGGTLADLQSVTATNSGLTQYKPAQLRFDAKAGTTYRIAVASASSSSLGTLDFHIRPGGQFDTNAPVVSVTSPPSGQTVFGNIIALAGTASDPGPNPSGVSQVFVTVNGTPLPTAIGTASWMALVALQPDLNLIKITAVDEAGNFSTTVTIQVNYLVPTPANDFFVNALPLTANPEVVTNSNVGATKEVGEPDIADNPGGQSLWWTYQPPGDGVLTLSTANSTFDTLLGLYTGANVASLTPVADNDDAYPGAPGGFSLITQAVRGIKPITFPWMVMMARRAIFPWPAPLSRQLFII